MLRAALVGWVIGLPQVAAAQVGPGWTSLSLEGFAGGATFGRFLEQRIDGGERELRIPLAFSAGGAVGVMPWRNTVVRLGFTWAGSGLEFEDDSGFDSVARDLDPLRGLFASTLSGEVMRFLYAQDRHRLGPYVVGGVTGTFWTLGDLDEDDLGVVFPGGGDETLFRVGANAGIGLQVRATDQVVVRAEVNNFALGNPFDGRNSFLTIDGGTTLSEPDVVTMSRFTVGVTYQFDPRS